MQALKKTLGPAGLTIVIIDKDFMKNGDPNLPNLLRYSEHSKSDSMLNTPPTFFLVCCWQSIQMD